MDSTGAVALQIFSLKRTLSYWNLNVAVNFMVPQTSMKRQKPTIAGLEAALESEKQRRLEVERRLQRANADFEDFTTKVVHDLREPLRTVNIYCELISADPGSAEAGKFLEFILAGVDRGQNLLAGITEYASAARERRPPVRVDMNAVFADSAGRVTQDQAGPAVFTHDPLPAVTGDFDSLAKVMKNLLENAIKFGDKAETRTHVSSRKAGNEWLISVQDNGPGIDAAHYETIFSLFKRLHGREYPGHGIGLAFCKKVVERHGGRIWVDSTLGAGSTFYFTLPGFD
jgi:light-regulated signal transduction histidine kinase (bacteriophytochrome)